jgi:hypothetical protein
MDGTIYTLNCLESSLKVKFSHCLCNISVVFLFVHTEADKCRQIFQIKNNQISVKQITGTLLSGIFQAILPWHQTDEYRFWWTNRCQDDIQRCKRALKVHKSNHTLQNLLQFGRLSTSRGNCKGMQRFIWYTFHDTTVFLFIEWSLRSCCSVCYQYSTKIDWLNRLSFVQGVIWTEIILYKMFTICFYSLIYCKSRSMLQCGYLCLTREIVLVVNYFLFIESHQLPDSNRGDHKVVILPLLAPRFL